MRAFSHQQNRQTLSATLTAPAPRHPAPLVHLQRTFGNQAVLRLVEATDRGRNRAIQRWPVPNRVETSEVKAARDRGRAIAKRINNHTKVSKEVRAKITGELTHLEGAAKEAYLQEVRPALLAVNEIDILSERKIGFDEEEDRKEGPDRRRTLSLIGSDPLTEASTIRDEQAEKERKENARRIAEESGDYSSLPTNPEEPDYWGRWTPWLLLPIHIGNETKLSRRWEVQTIEHPGDQANENVNVDISSWTMTRPALRAYLIHVVGTLTDWEEQLAGGGVKTEYGIIPVADGSSVVGYYIKSQSDIESSIKNERLFNLDGEVIEARSTGGDVESEGIGPLVVLLPGGGLRTLGKGATNFGRSAARLGKAAIAKGWGMIRSVAGRKASFSAATLAEELFVATKSVTGLGPKMFRAAKDLSKMKGLTAAQKAETMTAFFKKIGADAGRAFGITRVDGAAWVDKGAHLLMISADGKSAFGFVKSTGEILYGKFTSGFTDYVLAPLE